MKIKSMYSVVMLTALTGCGLMEVGKTQSVSFSSNIDETTIFDRDGRVVCATPCEIELPRQKNDLYFVAKKAGYVNRPFFLTVVPEKSFFKLPTLLSRKNTHARERKNLHFSLDLIEGKTV